MSTIQTYKKIFTESLMVDEARLNGLKYQDVPEWDSVGHMNLMSCLEEAYKIELEIDDIIDFSSFEKGKEILRKYNVEI
jgi:acyl carrier protein